MANERKQLYDHPINQRLLALYVIYVLSAVVLLGLSGDHRSLGFIIFGVGFVAACVVVTRLAAKCPACGKDTRFHPITPVGTRSFTFPNINWFAPNRCPHCRSQLTKES